MKKQYERQSFKADSLKLIDQTNEIIAEHEADGYTLTLRQLYYQFVARSLIENTQRSYKRLGNTISNARLAGLISWEAIIDRTRHVRPIRISKTWATVWSEGVIIERYALPDGTWNPVMIDIGKGTGPTRFEGRIMYNLKSILATLIASAITILYVYFGYNNLSARFHEIATLAPNELGDFLAGAAAPLAFLWLVAGYFLQRVELQQNTRALELQSQELKRLVEENSELVNTNKAQLDELKNDNRIKWFIELYNELNAPQFATAMRAVTDWVRECAERSSQDPYDLNEMDVHAEYRSYLVRSRTLSEELHDGECDASRRSVVEEELKYASELDAARRKLKAFFLKALIFQQAQAITEKHLRELVTTDRTRVMWISFFMTRAQAEDWKERDKSKAPGPASSDEPYLKKYLNLGFHYRGPDHITTASTATQ